MIPDQELVQDDTSPDFQVQLLNEDRSNANLVGRQVTCTINYPGCCGPGRKLDTTAYIVDAPGGYVGHTWQALETGAPGFLYLSFTSRTGPTDPAPISYPWWGFYTIRIKPKLA